MEQYQTKSKALELRAVTEIWIKYYALFSINLFPCFIYSREDWINSATSALKISMKSFMEKLWKKRRKEKEKGEDWKKISPFPSLEALLQQET